MLKLAKGTSFTYEIPFLFQSIFSETSLLCKIFLKKLKKVFKKFLNMV